MDFLIKTLAGTAVPQGFSFSFGKNVRYCIYNLINEAKENVYISAFQLSVPKSQRTKEFSKFYQLINNAITRGVKFTFYTNDTFSNQIQRITNQVAIDYLRQIGCSVFPLRPKAILHAKVFFVDDKIAYVSSANLTFSSLYCTYEAGVLFANYPELQSVKSFFETLHTLKKC